MKNCSYCGAEYPDDAVVCTIDDTSLIETPLDTDGTETLSHGEKREPATETAVLESDVPPDGEAELCISCLFPNLPDSRWCKRCAAPMSSVVGILMPDAAQAVGVVVRRAVETPANVLIVSGIWVLNLPGLVLNTLLILLILGGGVGG